MATTMYGDLNPEQAGYLVRESLERSVPTMVLEPFVSGKTLPANETKTIRFRRFEGDINFAFANMYITEGVTPTAQTLTQTDYILTLRQMGTLFSLTDVVNDTHPNDVLSEQAQILSEQQPRIIERDRYSALRACTNKYYSGSATSRGTVVAPVQIAGLEKIKRALRNANALQVTMMAKTGAEFNTVSVKPAYIAACHTDLEYDIENLPGFKSVADYPMGMTLLPGEIGSVKDYRFVLSPDLIPYADAGANVAGTLSTSGVKSDVYPIIIFAQKAWDSVAFKGKNAFTPILLNPNRADSGNPMGLVGYVSWKTMGGSLITNPLWMAVLEVAATAL